MEEKNLKETDEMVEKEQSDQTAMDTTAALSLEKVPADDAELEDDADMDEDTDDEEDEDVEADDEEDNTPPYCDKVFGVYRLALYGICFGYGGGLLVTGLFGIITGREVTTSSIPGIIGAVIGYLIGAYATKRLQAKAKAEAEAQQKSE